MPRHGLGAAHLAYTSHITTHGHNAPAYGLLEPVGNSPVDTSPPTSGGLPAPVRGGGSPRRSPPAPLFSPNSQLGRRHSRKPGSFGRSVGRVVPAWSEVEAGFDELLDIGSEFGASIGVLGDKLGRTVPGVKGGVAFLSTLRSNIRLSSDIVPPSPSLYPLVSPLQSPYPFEHKAPFASSAEQPRPSPPASFQLVAPQHAVPKLVFEPPSTTESRVSGLQLIVDSVAQTQHVVATKILRSEISYATAVSAAVVFFLYLYEKQSDLLIIAAALAISAASLMLAVRWLASGYVTQAASVDWDWLGEDEMLVARLGDEVVGAVAYRVAAVDSKSTPEAPKQGKRNRRRSSVTRVGIVRAWTVRKQDRGHGVGRALLEAAAKACIKEKRCGNVIIAEDAERAGAHRELPAWLSGPTGVDEMFVSDKKRSERTLEGIVAGLVG